MPIGQFSDRLVLQRRTVTQSVFGEPLEDWTNAFAIWARPLRADEQRLFSDDQIIAPVRAEWELRYDSRLASIVNTADYRLVVDNQVYQVLRLLRLSKGQWIITGNHLGDMTVAQFYRFAGVSVDRHISGSELTVSSLVSEITVPTFSQNRYLAFAVPDDQQDIDSLEVVGTGLNLIASFQRQDGLVVTDTGVPVKVWRTGTPLRQTFAGTVWEIGLSDGDGGGGGP